MYVNICKVHRVRNFRNDRNINITILVFSENLFNNNINLWLYAYLVLITFQWVKLRVFLFIFHMICVFKICKKTLLNTNMLKKSFVSVTNALAILQEELKVTNDTG